MRIRREHALGAEELRRRIDHLAEDICGRFQLRSEWRGDDLAFSGNGVNGAIRVREHVVEVNASLGFALKLMEPAIRSAVEDAMDRHLA